MKSRTSFFNKTVFKKDVTRFAPAWGAYLIVLVLALISLADERYPYYRVINVQTAISVVAWANLIYAAVVAQLLFGDLYVPRMCNALHAMPVNRETFFGTHVVSGIAFSLIPNLVITLLALPIMRLENGWTALFWWLLASQLQYLFFFGVAVLCVMLSGNRLGQLALYGMIQFAGLAAAWLASSIYEPLLHGIQFDLEVFYPFCPLARIMDLSDVLVIDYERILDEFDNFMYYELYGVAPGEGWGYMAICAGIGVVALIGALALYRKRKLECAGDFVAFAPMAPVVLVLVTLFAGGVFHLFGDVFGMNMKYVLIFCGMIVGFFACRMMLMRTTRVFQKKAFLGCGAILAVFALTLGLTYLDPIGVTRYMPGAEEVESITVSRSYSLYRHAESPFTVTESEDIEAIQGVHADCIDRSAEILPEHTEESYSLVTLRMEYKLKNGKTVNRFYDVHPLTEAGQVLKGYFTTPECVLGFPQEKVSEMANCIRSFYVQGQESKDYNPGDFDMEGLLNAVIADCEAGNMAQVSSYHYPNNYDLLGYDAMEIDDIIAYLEIGWESELLKTALQGADSYYGTISRMTYTNLRVYRSCENTLKWLDDNGLITEEQQLLIEKFGGPEVVFETKHG